MIEFLWSNDKLWRSYALKICKSEYTADDLVQEMYLKLKDKKDLSKKYVYLTLLSIFIDSKRKEKHNLNIDDNDKASDNKIEFEQREHLEDELQKVPFKIRECFIEHQFKSYREMQAEFNINYATLRRMSEKAKLILSKSEILRELYYDK